MELYKRAMTILRRLARDLNELKDCINYKPEREITKKELEQLVEAKNEFAKAMKNLYEEN